MDDVFDPWVLTHGDLAEVPSLSPIFRAWVREMFLRRNTELAYVLEAVIRRGKAQNKAEALVYLDSLIQSRSFERLRVTWSDLENIPRNRSAFQKLALLLEKSEDRASLADHSTFYGTIGHAAVPRLFAGELTNRVEADRNQLPLFLSGVDVSRAQKCVRPQLFRSVERLWRELKEDLTEPAVHKRERKIYKLYGLLAEIFGDYFHQARRYVFFGDDYHFFITMMTWAAASVHYRGRGPAALFREIPVLPASTDVGGGRIDALEVTHINGKTPSRQTLDFLLRMSQEASTDRGRHRSVAHLLKQLVRYTVGHLRVVVKDWKFAVGDGPRSMRGTMLLSQDIEKGPLNEHVVQMERYLALTSLGYHLLRRDRTKHIWESEAFDLSGQLVYLLPDCTPLVHEVRLSPQERESAFIREIVLRHTTALERSLVTDITRAVANHAVELMGQNGKGVVQPKRTRLSQSLLFPELDLHSKVSTLVGKYKEGLDMFVDPHRIVEIVRWSSEGEPSKYRMHIDRLLEAIERGDVEADERFDEVSGGKICCLLHQERTPSMSVSFSRGRFHCFGCGKSGGFAFFSIPAHISVKVTGGARIRVENYHIDKSVISTEHRGVMLYMQGILSSSFWESPAPSYLQSRGVDPELAFQYGAGFGDDRLLSEFIGVADFTLDDLVKYGFLGVSHRVKPSSPLVRALERLGLRRKQIERQIVRIEKQARKTVSAWPYSLLHGRVTFPLELEGWITGFYGRTVNPDEKKFKHTKLRTEVPHGAFNMKALESGSQTLVICEAVIDALTLIQMGHASTVAMVGINNPLLSEVFAGFRGNIAVAFDNDEGKLTKTGVAKNSGLESTAVLAQRLRQKGFRGQIRDLTRDLMARQPHKPFKDINDYWVTYGEVIQIN